MNEHTTIVKESDYGLLYCSNCETDIMCDENGDFSDFCPGCGRGLDWSEWNTEQQRLLNGE